MKDADERVIGSDNSFGKYFVTDFGLLCLLLQF
jgi:hypothetical protein